MKNKLKQNIIYNGLYQLLVISLPIFTTPYIVRVLSVEQVGVHGYVSSIVQLFIMLSFFGVNVYGGREIASYKDKKDISNSFWNIWIIQLIFSVICFIVFTIMNVYIFKSNNKVFFIQSFLIIINALEVSWFFVGIEELKKVVIRNTTIKLLFTLSIFIFIKTSENFFLYLLLNIISNLIGNLILMCSLKSYIYKPSIKLIDMKLHIKRAWLFLLPQISVLIYTSLDKTILGSLSGVLNVAYYDQSQKIIRIAITLVSSVGTVLLPRMCFYVKQGYKIEFNKLFTKTIENIIIISFYIVIGVICVAPSFVGWFFSSEYDNIVEFMQIISIIGLFIPISVIVSNAILMPMRKDKIVIKSSIYAAIISLTINFVLDIKMGTMGAIIALISAELFTMIYRIYNARQYYDFKNVLNLVFKCFISCILVYVIVTYINKFMFSSVISSFFIGVIVTILYFIFLIIMKEKVVLMYLKQFIIKIFNNKGFVD